MCRKVMSAPLLFLFSVGRVLGQADFGDLQLKIGQVRLRHGTFRSRGERASQCGSPRFNNSSKMALLELSFDRNRPIPRPLRRPYNSLLFPILP